MTTSPKKRAAGKGEIALLFDIGHHWRRATDAQR